MLFKKITIGNSLKIYILRFSRKFIKKKYKCQMSIFFFRKDNLLFDKDNENTIDISGKIIEVHGKIMSGRYGSNVPSDEVLNRVPEQILR